ncbi:hypothetical protein [Okeania sp. SIO2C9]|uniref:hypothetical protein n=1 Tax=Okeania sp. SIO2C9 TaxID=2607791 RepID=UPI0025DAD6D4|nr:hypothetical protein [Okeania sp. SIO2C9]
MYYSKGKKGKVLGAIELHRHCYDLKTAKNSGRGTHFDWSQITEEPDEVKVSRPVLETSNSSDGIA